MGYTHASGIEMLSNQTSDQLPSYAKLLSTRNLSPLKAFPGNDFTLQPKQTEIYE